MTHCHWLVWAHDGLERAPMPNQPDYYRNVVEIDVLADSEGEAMQAAERLAPGRQGYLLKKVSEHEQH